MRFGLGKQVRAGSTIASWLACPAFLPSLAVISNAVIDDRPGVFRRDRCAKGIDHLVYLGGPDLQRHERSIRADVVEAVACAAIDLDRIAARSILDRDRWFVRESYGRDQQQRGEREHRLHAPLT